MYTSIRLHTHRGMDCYLNDIGRINIICGKNNSGKTTVLEGIMNPDYRVFGKPISLEDWKECFPVLKVKPVLPSGSPDEVINLLFQTTQTRGTWFGSDQDIFADKYSDALKEMGMEPNADTDVVVSTAYNSLFKKTPNIIYIPPDRSIDHTFGLTNTSNAKPKGGAITNILFNLKNQDHGSQGLNDYNTIVDLFNDITGGCRFNIVLEFGAVNPIVKFAQRSQPWINSDSCGSGLQHLLVILYFSMFENYDWVLIEEPEIHMHPDMQRRLLYFLSMRTSRTFFMSTHSNVLLNDSLIDKVYYTSYNGQINIEEVTSKAVLLNHLGYSVVDNLVSDLIILTEGISDIPVLEEFLKQMGLTEKYNIKFWALGGDIMDRQDLAVFAEQYKILALIDKDPKSSDVRDRFESLCSDNGVHVTRLKRYAIENYFTIDAIRVVYPELAIETMTEIDPNVRLDRQIGWSVKKQNREVAWAMSLQDIEGTDLMDFLNLVKQTVESEVQP